MSKRPRITATWKDEETDFVPVELASNEQIIASGGPLLGSSAPTADHLVPGSKQFPCSLCGAQIWFAPSGQQILAAGKNPPLCCECAVGTIKTRA